MDNGTGSRGEAWDQLIREVIATWRLVFRAAVLVLVCVSFTAAVAVIWILITR